MRLRPAAITAAVTLAALAAAPAAQAAKGKHHTPRVPGLPSVSAAKTPVANAIPAEIGAQGTATFRINHWTPAGVDPARFVDLATLSGARWGLRALGETRAQPLVTDRQNVVGFTAETDAGALGVQRDVVQTVRHRATGRVLREQIIDRDLALAVDVLWQQGPEHPSAEQFDLETVLVHELGHMAGNKEHAELCANTPLVPSAAPGEWWRSPTDYFWTGCGALRTAGAHHAHDEHDEHDEHDDGAIEHRVERVTRWVG